MGCRSLLFVLVVCLTASCSRYIDDKCYLREGESLFACSAPSQDSARAARTCCVSSHLRIVCCGATSALAAFSISRNSLDAGVTRQHRSTSSLVSRSTIPVLDDGTLAGTKCREYGQYVYWKTQLQTLTVIPQYYNATECHLNGETLIVGGREAKPKEFPHMASLGYGPKHQTTWQCGGSLISELYILTAGHCTSAPRAGQVRWVRMGDHNPNSALDDTPNTLTKRVEKIFKYNGYKPPIFYNDIALLRLDSVVTFSPYIRPACLYTRPGNPVGLLNATASGWGRIGAHEIKNSDKLMKVRLAFQELPHCNQSYFHLIFPGGRLEKGINPDSMICAGDPQGKKDTCQGDSGGPLQIHLKDPFCMYSIIGVTSFGSAACGIGNTPGVYTRVSNYIHWIEGIVWPQE